MKNNKYIKKINLDDNHTVYLSEGIDRFYKERNQDAEYVISDVEKLLDAYDIVEFSKIYLDLDSDGESWLLTYK